MHVCAGSTAYPPALQSHWALTYYSLHMFPANQAQVGVGEIPPSAITVAGVVALKV